MSKFLLALGCLLCSVQGWTATLKGRIITADGRGISGAKILVINDLAAMMMLRSSSDRNGRYQFSIDPGHYHIFILKKGFQPINIKQLISHEQATFELNHDLQAELDLSDNQNADPLKRILRRSNREPNRDWTEPHASEHLAGLSLPASDESLHASVSTATYQSLEGQVSHQEKVQIKTRITPGVELRSTFTQERGNADSNSARQIQAGVSFDFQHVQFDASASTIDSGDQHQLGRSREVNLSGAYGGRVQAQTAVAMSESETAVDRHRQLSIAQGLSYELLALPVRQDLKFTEWDRNGQQVARQASISNTVTGSKKKLGVRTDVEHLSLSDQAYTTTKIWGQFHQTDTGGPIKWLSQIGVAAESDQRNLLQLHQAAWNWGNANLALTHVQDTAYKAMTAYDIFGDYARNNLTPYINEGFYRQQHQQSQVSLAYAHDLNWSSAVSLTHSQQQADLLHSENDAFMEQANVETTTVTYQLEALPFGTNLLLSHAKNEGNQAEFNTTGLTYAQAFSPFRARDLNLIVELSVRNQPGVPAWWLLHDLPWDLTQTDTWYEGQLRLNF